jgi:precorrin-3B methylase
MWDSGTHNRGDDGVGPSEMSGTLMSKQLSDKDRRAVDLMLNRILEVQEGKTVYASPNSVSQERLQAVQQVFELLAQWTPDEPSPDLISRTMKRIAESGARQDAGVAPTVRPTSPLA